MEEDGFVLVKQQKRKGKPSKKPQPPRFKVCQDLWGPFDLEHTVKLLLAAKEELAVSTFYSSVRDLILLGCESLTHLYCFGLGHLASPVSRHQTALLLLLQEELGIPTANTLVYDPVLSEEENSLLEKLGFQPQVENSECKITLNQKTLVYMPHCSKQLTNNLLYANWSPQGLSRLVLLSNSLGSVSLRTPSREAERSAQLITRVVEHSLATETRLPDSFMYGDVFNDTALHVFKMADLLGRPDSLWQVDQPVYDPSDMEYIHR